MAILTAEQAKEINEKLDYMHMRRDKYLSICSKAWAEGNEKIYRIASDHACIAQNYIDGMRFVIQVLGYIPIYEEEKYL